MPKMDEYLNKKAIKCSGGCSGCYHGKLHKLTPDCFDRCSENTGVCEIMPEGDPPLPANLTSCGDSNDV